MSTAKVNKFKLATGILLFASVITWILINDVQYHINSSNEDQSSDMATMTGKSC